MVLFLAVGCTRVDNTSLDTLLNATLVDSTKLKNVYRAGYTYYVPKGMRVITHESSNEILEQENNIYYMYVDRVSYYKGIKKDYKINTSAYYSRGIEHNDLFGYVEIKNTTNNKYFIEIMYNYAKIEVIVDKEEDRYPVDESLVKLIPLTIYLSALGLGNNVVKSLVLNTHSNLPGVSVLS